MLWLPQDGDEQSRAENLTHAIAHLDTDHHLTGEALSDQECDDADDLTALRLDQHGDLPDWLGA